MPRKAEVPRLFDLGGRLLSVGDSVSLPVTTGWGQYKSAVHKVFTVEKLGRTKVHISGRASAVDPVRLVKVGPPDDA